jgi:hypothetical protein
MTSRDYLETSLREAPGYGSEIRTRNKVRQKLTTFFKDRECVTLVRPVIEEGDLQVGTLVLGICGVFFALGLSVCRRFCLFWGVAAVDTGQVTMEIYAS